MDRAKSRKYPYVSLSVLPLNAQNVYDFHVRKSIVSETFRSIPQAGEVGSIDGDLVPGLPQVPLMFFWCDYVTQDFRRAARARWRWCRG
jgi:hypothetical protein